VSGSRERVAGQGVTTQVGIISQAWTANDVLPMVQVWEMHGPPSAHSPPSAQSANEVRPAQSEGAVQATLERLVAPAVTQQTFDPEQPGEQPPMARDSQGASSGQRPESGSWYPSLPRSWKSAHPGKAHQAAVAISAAGPCQRGERGLKTCS
jgi:hypothetical protein